MPDVQRFSWVLLGLLAACAGAAAQDYPNRPIRVIVANAPGSQADLIPRIMAPEMSKLLGEPLLVETKPGGNGIIGFEYVARQVPADGYTIIFASISALASLPAIVKDLRFDPLKDLRPVMTIAYGRVFLSTPAAAPWKTFNELVAYAKANPGKLNYGSANIAVQLRAEAINRDRGIEIVHVPYKGTANIAQGIAMGEVHLGFLGYTFVANLRDKMRVLAVTGDQRFPEFRDVPTFKELGLGIPGGDYSLNVPTAAPKQVYDRLHAAAALALQQPEVRAQLSRIELEAAGDTPEAAAKRLADEALLFSDIARKIGLKPQ